MPSAWVSHVKKFASEHKMKFGAALADKRCSASYKSLQTSTTRHGPTGFLPVDAAPKKKSAKRKPASSKSSSKRTQSKKTKTNSKSKVTKGRGRGRSRGKKSSTKTQSAGGEETRVLFYYTNASGKYTLIYTDLVGYIRGVLEVEDFENNTNTITFKLVKSNNPKEYKLDINTKVITRNKIFHSENPPTYLIKKNSGTKKKINEIVTFTIVDPQDILIAKSRELSDFERGKYKAQKIDDFFNN
jgi:hypothetical protein